MLRQMIIDKLNRLGEAYEDNGEWIKCRCQHPDQTHEHNTMSAGINTDTGVHSCFKDQNHNFPFVTLDDTSDESEEDMVWRAKYTNLTEKDEEEGIWEQINQPPVGHLITEEWRGISAELLEELCVYYCQHGLYRGRYIFGINKEGISIGFDSRIVDDTAKAIQAKWLRPKGMKATAIVYPLIVLKRMNSSHIVITEGVMDAISYIQMGIPAIPSFGIAPPHTERIEQLIALGVESVSIAFDNDNAGRVGALKVLPYYAEWFEIKDHPMVAMVRNSGYKDANEFLLGVRAKGLVQKEKKESWSNEEF